MYDARELKGGIFIDHDCSGLTILRHGVFIPYDINGGRNMRDLKEFLTKHNYYEAGECFPETYLNPDLWAVAEKHNRLEQEKQI